jgi:L-amino acid N-acyltransferase YncA
MKLVATREQLHEMIDDLPEADVDPVAEILASRVEPGDAQNAAQDEPQDALEFLRRLDSGEEDGYDFSVSEQLHAAR